MSFIRLIPLIATITLLTACGQSPAPTAATDAGTAAPSASAAGTDAPTPVALAATDPQALQAAATEALDAQRLYAPAGDNAIEYLIALRRQRPDDTATETALVELLPYAMIASEQAIARGEYDEARRLIALIAAVDARAPALARLARTLESSERDQVSRDEAERIALEQEEARRIEEARLAAAAPATTIPGATARPPAPPAPVASAPAPVAAAPAGERAAAAPAATAAVPAPVPAATAVPSPAATPPAAAAPRLISSPPPRYPPIALRRRIEGEVTVEFAIKADGTVGDVRVVTATPSGVFDNSALVATRQWRFAATGQPATTRQLLRFRLPDAARPRGG